ncbi:DNA repair protein RAD51 2 [Glycine soja]
MAKKLINQMGMPKSIVNIFTARNCQDPDYINFVARSNYLSDALSHTEFEFMELLDVGKEEVTSAMAHASGIVCPPCQTKLLNLVVILYMRYFCWSSEYAMSLAELVGPAGIGKTQVFCVLLPTL